MKFRLRSDDLQEVIYQREFPEDFVTTGSIEEARFELNFGDCMQGHWVEQWFDGIHILYGLVHIIRNLRLKAESETPVIEMHFALSGHTEVKFNNSLQYFEFNSGEHNLFYTPYFDGYLDGFEQKSSCKILEIHLTTDYFKRLAQGRSGVLDRLLDGMEKQRQTFIGERNRFITAEMYRVIHEILQCEKTGVFKRLFLESKVLELLTLQIEQYQESPIMELQKEDVEKLHDLKSFLQEHYSEAFSLDQLSRKAGLNEFKLKKGFRTVFGTTVFRYLRDLRLEEAKLLLLSGKKTIPEIADFCGYQNPQYFTTAFKKKYGITPGKYKH
ncbi:helix-turn-helix transcriptional regulator [Sinomicrobium weinanense]|uniref:Helix-turn-helix transcriptional regulator n=1 Tax=Sinomicrobium weinanense TaxID=2842200 RepID=A0A926JNC4_9FLAO|nr:AraC family transcriptional regulator [Sinomicrobium weinanense]MBC9794462.1 helix-turn-helix transcriptional regulator [Sinomicrobium weinanense]MBU3124369.1 AraC family transcriptional regulator [Sinomicrobium weinanense]